ncbi:MAG: hypothetical protein IJZ82_03430 [Lachnospiraceae bacterium]|nr:hypothetical protein [Lachnospiraceae bacterium]
MLALKVSSMKSFMNHLLVGSAFDNFLLAEGTISTANTYTMDGHINKEFYQRDDTASLPYDFATWTDMKGLCFNLIKGKRTPLYFKFVLHFKPELVSKLLAAGNCSLPIEQVKALVLTIKYDGNGAVLTTGTSFHTFVMNKEPDTIWDKAITQFLSKEGIEYEVL